MDTKNIITKNRMKYIITKLRESGSIKVQDLSTELGVSAITIRRDLDKLDERGYLERTHGGAVIKREIPLEYTFKQKNTMNLAEKSAIGKVASTLIKEGDTVLVNSGSTTLELLKHIKDRHVRVLTNNASAVTVDLDPKIELILIGGEYNRNSSALIGELAQIGLSRVYSSITVLGVNGIDVENGLTSSVYHETSINKMMIQRTQGPVIVVADHTKIGLITNFMTAPITDINTIVTDEHVDPEYVDMFRQIGIDILIAPLD